MTDPQRTPPSDSVIGGLMDLSFRRFITPSIAKVIYLIGLLLILLGALALFVSAAAQGVGWALAALVLVPLYAAFLVVVLRLLLETSVVFFRIYENTLPPEVRAAAAAGPGDGSGSGAPPTGPAGPPPGPSGSGGTSSPFAWGAPTPAPLAPSGPPPSGAPPGSPGAPGSSKPQGPGWTRSPSGTVSVRPARSQPPPAPTEEERPPRPPDDAAHRPPREQRFAASAVPSLPPAVPPVLPGQAPTDPDTARDDASPQPGAPRSSEGVDPPPAAAPDADADDVGRPPGT